jgi:MFS family permease
MYDIGQVVALGQQELVSPLRVLGLSLVNFIIGLVIAAVIIALGYVVSWAVHWVVKSALDRANVDKWLRKNNLDKSIGRASVSQLGSALVRWYIFLIFLVPAVSYITLGELTGLLLGIVSWLPRVIVGIAIMMFGLIIADFVSDCMGRAKGPWIKHLDNIVRVVIIVFVAVIALQEIGIYLRLAESTFLILLTGAALGLSLAFGIGFGLGFRDEATHLIKKWRKKW